MMRTPLHIHNARIWTGDPAQPMATAITLAEGRVHAVDDVEAPRGAMVIDARGRTISPGLIDSHMHLLRGGRSLSQLDLSNVRSRSEFERAIASMHHRLPKHDWLIGWGWSQENWPDRQMPNSTWLTAAGTRPAVCYRMDMHAVVVNDAALSLIGAAHDLRKPITGGSVEMDRHSGAPTGLMIEAAAWELVNPLIPKPDARQLQSDLRKAIRHCQALGITCVGSMEYAADVRSAFEPLRDELSMRCRITLLDREWPLDLTFARGFSNDEVLAVIGCKAFIDGTLGSRTARMLHEYADDPGNRGVLVELAAHNHLNEWARLVSSAGLSPSMHAIGDEAVRIALDALDAIADAARPRIEHAQHVDSTDLPRFRNRIASMQPLHKADDGRYMAARLSPERLAGAFPFRSLLEAGAVLAFGSDWPVVSCDPMLGMRTAVTGLTFDEVAVMPEQNLTIEQALKAYTVDAAYALGLNDGGVLMPGRLADLVMYDRDPFNTDWRTSRPAICMTIVGGSIVYDADGEKASNPEHETRIAGIDTR